MILTWPCLSTSSPLVPDTTITPRRFYVKSRRICGMDDVRIDSNVVHTADSTRLHVENQTSTFLFLHHGVPSVAAAVFLDVDIDVNLKLQSGIVNLNQGFSSSIRIGRGQ